MTHPARQFALLSTSDTDLLSARASGADWRLGNPVRLGAEGTARLVDGAGLVVVRILGVRRQYEDLLAPLLAGPAPVVVLGAIPYRHAHVSRCTSAAARETSSQTSSSPKNDS